MQTRSSPVAVVTGASRGIGRAIALALAEAGFHVVIGFAQRQAEAEAVAARVAAYGRIARIVRGDVARPHTSARLCQEAVRLGRLEVWVNAAGHAHSALLVDTAPAEWRRMLAVHLDGTYLGCRAALGPMLAQRSGLIVNLSSMWGQVGAAGEVAYSAAKAGVIGLTKALAKEVAPAGVRVNAIAPGPIATDMLADFTAEELAEIVDRTPLGRLGQPEEVAEAVLYLLRDRFTTGQVLAPNGGFVI